MGERHPGETCSGSDWPCLWLGPGTVCGWSPHLIGCLRRFPQGPALHCPQHREQPCPPSNARVILQRDKGVPSSAGHHCPLHSRSRSMWLSPAAWEMLGPPHRQERSSDTTQKWGPGSFENLPPNPQPLTAVRPCPKSCWQPCDRWKRKVRVASGHL